MNLALDIAAMRRGACPTLDAPMQTGDGLLARIRPVAGRIDSDALEQLAGLAGRFGNGIVEITARGNLQVRGLVITDAAAFAQAVRGIMAIETGLVVETPPLAGDDPDEITDPRPVAAAIRHGSLGWVDQLAPKVSVIVDGAGQIGLADLKADVRLVALSPGRWALSIGPRFVGATHEPAACAIRALEALAALGPSARGKHLHRLEFHELVEPIDAPAQVKTLSVGTFRLGKADVLGLALPYGAIGWQTLAAFAKAARRLDVSQMRLAPHHGVLAVGAGETLRHEAARLGLITAPEDPRTRISACVGNQGCASGSIAARIVAEDLAPMLGKTGHLHVSGCAKGCAHPRRADLTLVGRADGYGLVINGTAGDTPQAVLRADQLAGALAHAQG